MHQRTFSIRSQYELMRLIWRILAGQQGEQFKAVIHNGTLHSSAR